MVAHRIFTICQWHKTCGIADAIACMPECYSFYFSCFVVWAVEKHTEEE